MCWGVSGTEIWLLRNIPAELVGLSVKKKYEHQFYSVVYLCSIYFLFQQSEALRDLVATVNATTVTVCRRDKGMFVVLC
jgi:hypothetical protein